MGNFNDLIQQNSVVLVDFYATWCGPCQTLAPILKEIKDEFGDSLTVIKIDVDKNQAIARNFSVQGVPTLVLYKDGQQVWRQSGLLTKSQLSHIIKQYN